MKNSCAKRCLSLLMTLAMLLTMVPATVFATGADTDVDGVTVYFSASHDDQYMVGADTGEVMALKEITVPYFDLSLYGLEEYYFVSESYGDDGDGLPGSDLEPGTAEYAEGKVTVLHLYLYALERFKYGLSAEEAGKGYLYDEGLIGTEAFSISGGVGSSFLNYYWGYDCNLNYYVNYQYPLASEGWGATSDQMLLREGDIVTLGQFTSWSFYGDSASIFNYIKIGDDVGETTVQQGEEVTLSLLCAGPNLGTSTDTAQNPITYCPNVYCIAADQLGGEGDVCSWKSIGYADDNGELVLDTTDMEPGKYLVALPGQYGVDYPDDICSSPGGIWLNVEAVESDEEPVPGADVDFTVYNGEEKLTLTAGDADECVNYGEAGKLTVTVPADTQSLTVKKGEYQFQVWGGATCEDRLDTSSMFDAVDEATLDLTAGYGFFHITLFDATATVYHLYVEKEGAEEVAVTFDANGGKLIGEASVTVAVGEKLTAPEVPTKTGYTFKGWKTVDDTVWDFENDTVSAKMTLTAEWEINQYTMTFKDGDSVIGTIEQDYGTAVTAPVPTKTGYTFAGWDAEVPETMPAENKTFTAQWQINQYTITFNTDGGSEIAAITQDYGTAVTAPADPTKTGHTFTGWDAEIPETMPAENKTFTAQWQINQYTITFNTDGGSEIAAITQDYGTAVTAPADPTKTGYTFKGWDKEIPATIPADGLEITAQWDINQYTVTFDSNRGSEVESQTVDYNTKATEPATPSRSGYRFRGWYTADGTQFDFNTAITEDITLTAKWSKKTSSASSSSSVAESEKNVENAEDLIDTIGKVTMADKEKIEAAREAYDKLSKAEQKKLENYEELLAAEQALEELLAAQEKMPFADVSAEDPAYDAIAYVYENGLMSGVNDGTNFAPASDLSRSMLASVLYRYAGSPAVVGANVFTDAPTGMWYTDAVLWANSNGIISGYGDGKSFGPNDSITREQLASILFRFAQGVGVDVTTETDYLAQYADGAAVSHWAAEAMNWAVGCGVLNPVDGAAASGGAASRAQIAQALMALIENVLP